MRSKIWYEMVDAKYGENYLALYLSRCKNVNKWFKILTLIFSGGGVFGWSIWEPVALITCIIIALIQLLTLIENHIIRSEDDLIRIGDLRNLYVKYFNSLEKLWFDFGSNQIDKKQAGEIFFNLKSTLKVDIERIDNELHITQKKSLLSECDKLELKYFENRYG